MIWKLYNASSLLYNVLNFDSNIFKFIVHKLRFTKAEKLDVYKWRVFANPVTFDYNTLIDKSSAHLMEQIKFKYVIECVCGTYLY